MRAKFDRQLEQLNQELIAMGSLCSTSIASVTDALINDVKIDKNTVVEFCAQIDQSERDIERLCIKMLLQQQPVANDLRQISSALKLITDMERIGKQAEEIARIVAKGNIKMDDSKRRIKNMAVATIKMVNTSVDAFVSKDLSIANEVIAYDDELDNLFSKSKKDIIQMLRDGVDEEEAIGLLMIAKYFERIGDHATNIAGWVIFSVTGVHPTL